MAPEHEFPVLPQQICTCWEGNTETHHLSGMTPAGLCGRGRFPQLALNQTQHPRWSLPQIRLGCPFPLSQGLGGSGGVR